MARSAIAAFLVALGCSVEAAECHEPGSVQFVEVARESSCGDDWIEQDLATCRRLRGDFDEATCFVQAAYVCSGGVRAAVGYWFPPDEPATGTESYWRLGDDGCRVERTMVEAQ